MTQLLVVESMYLFIVIYLMEQHMFYATLFVSFTINIIPQLVTQHVKGLAVYCIKSTHSVPPSSDS